MQVVAPGDWGDCAGGAAASNLLWEDSQELGCGKQELTPQGLLAEAKGKKNEPLSGLGLFCFCPG